jgi:hypothetical protein
MQLAPDFDEFIESLIAHGVEFVVVGAYALAFHGAPRFTSDLDILAGPHSTTPPRLGPLSKALKSRRSPRC